MQTKVSTAMAGPGLREQPDQTLPNAPGEHALGALPGASPQEFNRALCEHEHGLRAKALTLTRDNDEARDLIQDTLVKGMRSMEQFRPGTNMRAWLMRIMVNLFIDRCRQTASRPALVPLNDEANDLAPPREPETEPLSARITLDQLHHAMRQLDPIFREAYELRITRNLSYEQIAAQLNIPIGTVGTRLLRAREGLCRLLTPQAQHAEGVSS